MVNIDDAYAAQRRITFEITGKTAGFVQLIELLCITLKLNQSNQVFHLES